MNETSGLVFFSLLLLETSWFLWSEWSIQDLLPSTRIAKV